MGGGAQDVYVAGADLDREEHVKASQGEGATCSVWTGRSPSRSTPSPRSWTSWSHANTSSGEELGLLAAAGAAVSCTPESEAQMGMGFPVLGRARAASVTVGLGFDLSRPTTPRTLSPR